MTQLTLREYWDMLDNHEWLADWASLSNEDAIAHAKEHRHLLAWSYLSNEHAALYSEISRYYYALEEGLHLPKPIRP